MVRICEENWICFREDYFAEHPGDIGPILERIHNIRMDLPIGLIVSGGKLDGEKVTQFLEH